jgi:hypothetical protein
MRTGEGDETPFSSAEESEFVTADPEEPSIIAVAASTRTRGALDAARTVVRDGRSSNRDEAPHATGCVVHPVEPIPVDDAPDAVHTAPPREPCPSTTLRSTPPH